MIELLRTRRSIRRFLDRPIGPEAVAGIEEALLRAPTSRNSRPCRFVVVEGRPRVAVLAGCKPSGAAFLAEATLAVVVAADPSISDMWIEDASIAATFAQLAAHALGLGSCWCQVRGRPHDERLDAEAWVREQLGLAPALRVLCIVGIGHPAEDKPGWPASSLDPDRVTRVG